MADFYHRLGLNGPQRHILATAVPKRQYYCISEEGQRLYDLALGPLALAFVGISDKETLATLKALEARHGPRWVDAWLALKDVPVLSTFSAPEAAA